MQLNLSTLEGSSGNDLRASHSIPQYTQPPQRPRSTQLPQLPEISQPSQLPRPPQRPQLWRFYVELKMGRRVSPCLGGAALDGNGNLLAGAAALLAAAAATPLPAAAAAGGGLLAAAIYGTSSCWPG